MRFADAHYYFEIAKRLCFSFRVTASKDSDRVETNRKLREFHEDRLSRRDRRELKWRLCAPGD
jgi:hypothetical protein